jgi:hypothetical protein
MFTYHRPHVINKNVFFNATTATTVTNALFIGIPEWQ